MKKILLATTALLNFYTYAQGIENGTYIAKEKGQNIRLILNDNQYDLSLMSGKFEIKNDSIILKSSQQKKCSFELVYGYSQSKLDKIQINIKSNNYDISNIYISTFSGSSTPIYKRVGDVKVDEIIDLKEQVYNNNLVFLIDRADFLVLVKEDYLQVSEMTKFKIPENVSEISVEVQNLPNENLKLSGTFNSQTKELTISENGRNPLVFQLENQKQKNENQEITPTETKKINNWTYPGKEINETANPAIDQVTENTYGNDVVTNTEKPKFQLQVENNLNVAIASNAKMSHKFLVIYYDPKNKNAKSDFDNFIKEQNKQLNYNMYEKYDKKYDLFNYYFASKQDEKWLKTKNIKNFPCLIAVNSDGEVLSQSQKSLFDLQNQFYYYDDFGKNLTRNNALLNFKKIISKTSKDTENIKAFADVVALEIPYEYNEILPVDAVKIDQIDYTPPIVNDKDSSNATTEKIREVPEEQKADSDAKKVTEADEYLPPVIEEIKPDFNIFNKPVFDKKQVQVVWNNLIENHKNDLNPNIDLALIIIKELKNIGFSKQLFNYEKLFDATNYIAFDYLFKHFDEIEKARINGKYNVDAIHDIDLFEIELKNILNGQIKLIKPETPIAIQQKTIECYKRYINLNKFGSSLNEDYFELLKKIAIKSKSDKEFVQEYDAFFNKLFDSKINLIENLDNLYQVKKDTGYETWTEFKNSYANSANNSAWYVVQHSKNIESIKKAIKWSETSLKMEKNNHYFLDTLAQLYYLNGEKTKAIATQQMAIDKVGTDDIEEYKSVLEKMKNGTY